MNGAPNFQKESDAQAVARMAAQGKTAAANGNTSGYYNSQGESQGDRNAQINQNLTPEYGGVVGGANQFADYANGLGAQAAQTAAPTIDMGAANVDRGFGLAGLHMQQQGLGALGVEAQGGGPGAAAAQSGFNVGANQTMLQALQASGAGRGASGAAAAQSAALQQNAQGMGAGAVQAGGARANAAMQGAQAFQQGAQGYSSNVAGLSGADWDAAARQADLQENQNQINQQGQLGFLGLGMNAQLGQLNADTSAYAGNIGATTAANALAAQQTVNNVGLGLGAVQAGGGVLSQFGQKAGSSGSNPNPYGTFE